MIPADLLVLTFVVRIYVFMLDVVQTIVAAPHLQTTNSNTRWQKIFERRQSFVRRGKRGKFIVVKKYKDPILRKYFHSLFTVRWNLSILIG